MEIKGQGLSWHEEIQLQSFQRLSALLHLNKVLSLTKSCVKKQGGEKAEPEADPMLIIWIFFARS